MGVVTKAYVVCWTSSLAGHKLHNSIKQMTKYTVDRYTVLHIAL